MAIQEDLIAELDGIFPKAWDEQATESIPDPEDVRLNNHAKHLGQATVLYADLNGSTKMVDNFIWWFSAEIYKAYLRCAARIIVLNGGRITAYDGDRIMAIYTGESKNTSAVRSALCINWAVTELIRPAILQQYPSSKFELNHSIGIDSSELRASRIGVRGNNDLVWIGRAANHAAKLTSVPGAPIWITKHVHDKINDAVKFHEGTSMWKRWHWTSMENAEIYSSTYIWRGE